MDNIIESIHAEISKFEKVDKLFFSSQTYLKVLEEEKSIRKEGKNFTWDKPLPIKYLDNKPLWGNIPIEIDDYCHEYAIVGE